MGHPAREELDLNFGWKFLRDDVVGAYEIEYDDSAWREVRLPHDWSIESAFTQENTVGRTAWLPAGVRCLADGEDHILKWLVPYEAGSLVAVGQTESAPVRFEMVTAGAPSVVRLSADKIVLRADGYDVAHLTVQLCDADGIPVKTEEREVVFQVLGGCRVLGVDNGSNTSVQPYKSDRCTTAQGRCLLIVQSTDQRGTVVVTASAEGLQSQSVALHVC